MTDDETCFVKWVTMLPREISGENPSSNLTWREIIELKLLNLTYKKIITRTLSLSLFPPELSEKFSKNSEKFHKNYTRNDHRDGDERDDCRNRRFVAELSQT